MRVGWVALDGTNSWDTVSTLGTNIAVRIGLFKRFLVRGEQIAWFGLKKNSHLIESKPVRGITDYPTVHEHLNERLRKNKQIWDSGKAKNSNQYSMSKWVAATSIDEMLDWYRKNEVLPKLDALFLEYMDNGFAQISYFSVLMIHYARLGVPIYVRDVERRFRYISELALLHESPRDNMYSHRLGRYITDDHIADLHGKIRMVYPFHADWDHGTDGFYRLPSHYLPTVYDVDRELPLPRVKDKKYPILLAANDNNRREAFQQWYTPARYDTLVAGNWQKRDPEYVKQIEKANRKLRFREPVPQRFLLEFLREGWATIFLLPKMCVPLGQVTDRVVEAALAGIVNFTPSDILDPDRWTLPQFILDRPDYVPHILDWLMSRNDKQLHNILEEQRNRLYANFNGDYVFEDLLEVFAEDGVKL